MLTIVVVGVGGGYCVLFYYEIGKSKNEIVSFYGRIDEFVKIN